MGSGRGGRERRRIYTAGRVQRAGVDGGCVLRPKRWPWPWGGRHGAPALPRPMPGAWEHPGRLPFSDGKRANGQWKWSAHPPLSRLSVSRRRIAGGTRRTRRFRWFRRRAGLVLEPPAKKPVHPWGLHHGRAVPAMNLPARPPRAPGRWPALRRRGRFTSYGRALPPHRACTDPRVVALFFPFPAFLPGIRSPAPHHGGRPSPVGRLHACASAKTLDAPANATHHQPMRHRHIFPPARGDPRLRPAARQRNGTATFLHKCPSKRPRLRPCTSQSPDAPAPARCRRHACASRRRAGNGWTAPWWPSAPPCFCRRRALGGAWQVCGVGVDFGNGRPWTT